MQLLIRSPTRTLIYTVLKEILEKFVGIVIRISYSSCRDTQTTRFYKTTTIPVLSYGSGLWTMAPKDKRKVEVLEMPLQLSLAGISQLGQNSAPCAVK
jgi:hypothetical protein